MFWRLRVPNPGASRAVLSVKAPEDNPSFYPLVLTSLPLCSLAFSCSAVASASDITWLLSSHLPESLLMRTSVLLDLGSTVGASQVMLVLKDPPANAGDTRDTVSIPGWERSPGEGNGNPLHYPCLENPMDRGAWWATILWGAGSQTWLRDWAHTAQYDLILTWSYL